jgi:hypothetical protein
VPELHERHSARELSEQYIAEEHWPVGEAAKNLRAELIALTVANSIAFDQRRDDRIKTIWEKLDGYYDPGKAAQKKQPPGKEQMKAAFGC